IVGVKKQKFESPEDNKELIKLVEKLATKKLNKSIESKLQDKRERDSIVSEALEPIKEHFDNLPEDDKNKDKLEEALGYAKDLEKKLMRKQIMEKGERIDGRKCNEIRPIWSQVSFLPNAHGSAIFTRGSTQALSVATLGSGFDAKPIDGIWPEKEQTYYHHYNFPAYSVGEARPARSTSRRELGHGALAERALIASLPDKETFPYVIRVVSDVLSSNGSTSMASTCGSTLALMDAGVPIKEPVAGIAMGLIWEEGKCAILSDIQGVEDFLGDMDFKVTGSHDGVTAIQLDLKLKDGISLQVLKVALDQALEGRRHILAKMLEALEKPREEMPLTVPRIVQLKVDEESVGEIIGPGGKNIKRLIEETGVEKVDIADGGYVSIIGMPENVAKAKEALFGYTFKLEAGQEYKGEIVRTMPIGVFVDLGYGKVGLLKDPSADRGRGRNDRGRGRGGYDRGRGHNNDDRNNEQDNNASNSSGLDFSQYQVGQQVYAIVKGTDQRGRIDLASIRLVEG
ncbi:MAG TPA: polyribonucleotide nucleotidyltransferase, partial [Vampirovibrionales bacterium]